jgi:hypothetical protein
LTNSLQQNCASAPCFTPSLQPQTTASAVESSHVFVTPTVPPALIDFQVNNTSASVIYVYVFDATVAPTGGGAAVTGCTNAAAARPCVLKSYQVGANSTIGVTWAPGPFLQAQTGIVIACSSTFPFTLTYSVSCAFSGEMQ